MGSAAYITGSRADLQRITRALNAGPFVDPVLVEGKPMSRRTARAVERALTKKFSPPPVAVAPAGDVAQQRTGHPLPQTAAAPAGAVVKLPASLTPHPTCEAGSFIFNHFEHGSHVGHE